jgi:hypothetical protein
MQRLQIVVFGCGGLTVKLEFESQRRIGLVCFRSVTRGASSRSYLYAIVSSISIYSSHVHSVVENCAQRMFSGTRSPDDSREPSVGDVRARQTAIYLAHVAFGLTYTEIGQIFRRDRSTVAHACAVIEDLRDDPAIDQALTAIERVLAALPGGMRPIG